MSDPDLPPLTVGPDGPDGPVDGRDREARARRTRRRIGAVGAVLALAGAAAVGVLTGSGGASLGALCIGLALTAGVTALVTLVGAVRDELRGVRVPPRRVVLGVVLLAAAPVLLLAASGAVQAA